MKSCPACRAVCHDQARFCPSCGANVSGAQASPSDPFVGLTLSDKYLVKRLIGEGGMGRVYEAEQILLEKPVAVKILHRHLVGDEHSVARFVAEAREASRLNHPNIVSVLEFGETPAGVLYLVMEYLRGKPLADVIVNEYPMAFVRVVSIFRQILLAVAEAHRLGVIHRDLKPDNVFIELLAEGRERVKVIDFGIAKRFDQESEGLTSPGMVCGTPEYMSPEQVHGEPLDPRSDVYALGVILYEMLVGSPPFQSKSPAEVMVMQAEDEPLSPSVVAPETEIPPSLDAIVHWALAKDPGDRIESAEAFRKVMDSWIMVTAGGVETEAAEGMACPSCHAVNPPGTSGCYACGYHLPSDAVGEGARFLQATLGAERLKRLHETQKIPIGIDLATLTARSTPSTTQAQTPGAAQISRYLPLVGRSRERDGVLRWLGEGGTYRVVGEPGSGKSRLLDELASRARDAGYDLLRLSPREDSLWPAPLFLVQQVAAFLLRADVESLVRPEEIQRAARSVGLEDEDLAGLEVVLGVPRPLHRALSREAEHREALAALSALLRVRAKTHPVALLLEDLELADAPSRLAVSALVEASLGLPVLLVTTHAESPEDDANVAETLAVRPLGRSDALRLCAMKQRGEELGPEAAALVDIAGGNPFYLDHLVRLQHEGGLPGRLRRRIELLDARIDRLPIHLRQVLQRIAVHGGRVPVDRLNAMQPADLGDLDLDIAALEEMGLVDTGPGWVGAAHDLVERAVLAAMPAEVRRETHSRLLRLLVPERRAVGARARHALGAEDHEAVADVLDLGAAITWQSHDPLRAMDWLHRALQSSRLLWGRSTLGIEALTRNTAEIARRLAEVLFSQGDLSMADAVLGEAETFLTQEQPALGAAVTMDRAKIMLARGNVSTAEELLERALKQTLGSEEAGWLQCQILQRMAEMAIRRGHYERALDLFSEGYGMAVHLDQAGHGEAWRFQMSLGELRRGLGDSEEAEAFLDEARVTAERAGWSVGALAAQRAMAKLLVQKEDYARAANYLAEAIHLARGLGDRGVVAAFLLDLAGVQERLGNVPAAAKSLSEASSLASRVRLESVADQASMRLEALLH